MNLIIGKTAQLAKYFPDDYVRISSYDIDLDFLKSETWDSVYVMMSDSRTFVQNSDTFWDINVKKTTEIIDALGGNYNRLVWYATADLWNNHSGAYDLQTPYCFRPNDYMFSKYTATKALQKNRRDGVVIHYPVNFNSIHRKNGFLFWTIFNSIKNKVPVTVKNLNFHREVLHPRYVVSRTIASQNDEIIGSGRLTHIGDFVKTLYSRMGLKYSDYVTELNEDILHDKLYVSKNMTDYTFDKLVDDTLKDFYDAN